MTDIFIYRKRPGQTTAENEEADRRAKKQEEVVVTRKKRKMEEKQGPGRKMELRDKRKQTALMNM